MTCNMAAMMEIARQAAGFGADLLMDAEPGDIRRKSDRDFVTDLDVRIQGVIRQFLEERTPGIGFLGEEGQGSLVESVGSGAVWVLDPIDGTSNFIHGLPLSAVSLALVERGVPAVGVIAAPFLGLEYRAVRGCGAFSGDRRMACSSRGALGESIVSLGDYAVGVDADRKNRRRVALAAALAAAAERVRMFGSAALDLAWVAEGRTEGCVIHSNKPWDTAAGVLIARESGALVTDSSGRAHDFGSADTVAAAPGVQGELLELIRVSGL